MVGDSSDGMGDGLSCSQVVLVLQSEGDPDRKESCLGHAVHHSQDLGTGREGLQCQETTGVM